MRPEEEIDNAIKIVLALPTASFTTLSRLAKLDPKRSFRFADLTDVDFSGLNLAGFNFHGADLSGCRFLNASICGADFSNAKLNVSDLAAAADWRAYKRLQQAAASNQGNAHDREEGLSFNQAMDGFVSLLRRRQKLSIRTILKMMQITPSYGDAIKVLELVFLYNQPRDVELLRAFACKIPESIVSAWLVRIIQANINLRQRDKDQSTATYVTVEMSNLLGIIGVSEAKAYNRMLSESGLEESLALVNFYDGRRWAISSENGRRLLKQFEEAESFHFEAPPKGYRSRVFSRLEITQTTDS